MLNKRPEDAGIRLDSGVERLLAGAEPWRGVDEVAAHLLSAWISKFALGRCVLVWQDKILAQTVLLVGENTAQAAEAPLFKQHRFRLHGMHSIDELAQLLPDQAELLSDLHLMPLTGSPFDEQLSEPLIALLPRNAWDKIDEEWKQVSLTLLRWAAAFQSELQRQKLAALAEYAAGAGHEINNPLGSIIGRTSQLLKSEADAEKRRMLETIGAQAYRIGDMIGDTMLFAAPPPPRRQVIDLMEVVHTVLGKFQKEIAADEIYLAPIDSEATPVFADSDQMHIVVAELVRNSLRALSDNPNETPPVLEMTCSIEERHGRAGGVLQVLDNGPGLTSEQQQHCFDPFYSGRQAGRGLGFGLSKCWQIVQQHGGDITLVSHPGQTSLRVWIPATEST